MSAPAAISAQLVDVRNIAAHKCVRLEIHVPAEQAGAVLAAFGWPTAADPVPVAIARLMTAPAAPPEGQRRTMTLAAQAALRCQDADFRRFLARKFELDGIDEEAAAAIVRDQCGVKSRSALDTNDAAAKAWLALNDEFWIWRRDARAQA